MGAWHRMGRGGRKSQTIGPTSSVRARHPYYWIAVVPLASADLFTKTRNRTIRFWGHALFGVCWQMFCGILFCFVFVFFFFFSGFSVLRMPLFCVNVFIVGGLPGFRSPSRIYTDARGVGGFTFGVLSSSTSYFELASRVAIWKWRSGLKRKKVRHCRIFVCFARSGLNYHPRCRLFFFVFFFFSSLLFSPSR